MPRKRREGTTPRQVWDTEYFIQKAREIHGDRFDYSKTVYVKYALKVTIITEIFNVDIVKLYLEDGGKIGE